MREILFRGKRLDNGEWIEGFYCKHNTVKVCLTSDDPKPKHLIIVDGFCDWGFEPPLQGIEVDPATVGQFTGLMDKNGKQIFEGDIVICRQEIEGNHVRVCVEIGFIEMKFGAFGLHRKQGYYRPFKDWLEDYEYEVIGNIHDNPELVKGGESDG